MGKKSGKCSAEQIGVLILVFVTPTMSSDEGEGEDGLPIGLAELHNSIPTQVGYLSSRIEHFAPRSNFQSSGGFIKVEIEGGANEFIDTPATRVWFSFSLIKQDGSALAPDAEAGKALPINGIVSSLFKNVSVRLNNVPISHEDSFYAHRANIENRFFTPIEEQRGALVDGFFFAHDDIYENFTKVTGDHSETLGKRYAHLNGSEKSVQVCGKIYSPLFDQAKPLPPGCTLELSFERHNSAFCCMNKPVTIRLNDFSVAVKFNRTDQDVVNEVVRLTQNDPLKYQLRKTRIIPFPKGANLRDLSIYNLFNVKEKLPRKIFLAIIKQAAEQGSLAHDPFNYEHFDTTSIKLVIGGTTRPYEDLNTPLRQLKALRDATDSYLNGADNGIERWNHREKGNFVVGWDLSPTGEGPLESFTLDATENCHIHINCSAASTEPLTLLVYCENDAELLLDATGTPLNPDAL